MKRRWLICWFMTMLLLGSYFAVESKAQLVCEDSANGVPSGCNCQWSYLCWQFGFDKCCETYCIGNNQGDPYDGICTYAFDESWCDGGGICTG